LIGSNVEIIFLGVCSYKLGADDRGDIQSLQVTDVVCIVVLLQEAEAMHKKAIEIKERILGSEVM